MMRRGMRLLAPTNYRVPVGATMAIPMAQSVEEAGNAVNHEYSSRWFGLSTKYMRFEEPKSHFIPFYLVRGTVSAEFSATVEYTTTSIDAKGNTRTSSSYTSVPPKQFEKAFFEHNTQVYAGYRRDPKHVRVLQGEHIPTLMKPVKEVDLAHSDDVNQIEMNSGSLRAEVESIEKEIADEAAKKMVREWHAGARSITIHWNRFSTKIDHATPVFVPAYVVGMGYGDKVYKVVVCGVRGTVSGPRLYDPELVARIAAVSTFAVMLAVTRWSALAFASPFAAVGAYQAAFQLIQRLPDWRLARRRREQDAKRAANSSVDGDASQGAFRTSGAQQPKPDLGSGVHPDDTPSSFLNPQDPKGHYATLGVNRNASVNDIKAAFRKKALRLHPDAAGAGSTEAMAAVNAAYQVLRNPNRRQKYDSGDSSA